MKEIQTYGTHAANVLVDDEDFEELSKYRWLVGKRGYAVRSIWKDGATVCFLMHRLIMNAQKGQIVDHVNRNKLDNRRCNLRFADPFESLSNIAPLSTNHSGYKGVSWFKPAQLWQSAISSKNVLYHLGYYRDPITAAKAYDCAARQLHRSFAYLNFAEDTHIPYEALVKVRSRIEFGGTYTGGHNDRRRTSTRGKLPPKKSQRTSGIQHPLRNARRKVSIRGVPQERSSS